jgi:hypothetical protein
MFRGIRALLHPVYEIGHHSAIASIGQTQIEPLTNADLNKINLSAFVSGSADVTAGFIHFGTVLKIF